MSDLNFFSNNKNIGDGPHTLREPRFPEPINSDTLKNIFADCSDFQTRDISPGLAPGKKLFVCWLDGTVDGTAVSTEILRPLTDVLRTGFSLTPERIMEGAVYSGAAMLRTETDKLVSDLTQGCAAVVFDGSREAVTFEVRTQNVRSISEPQLEKSLKGAKDSFTERLRINTALVRSRICNPSLKTEDTLIGRKSETRAVIIYVDGVANPAHIVELKKRIDAIDVDGALATGNIEEYITDKPRSAFPQLIHTERPDRFARQLLNGRVGLIIDGLPVAFLIPATFAEFLRVPQDDSLHFTIASVLSVIRWLALIFAVALPAFYVAVAMYHQEMIPTKLLMSIIQSKQNVPFSTALEVLGMLIAFELLQEASLRLPDPIAATTSIIGALIVGQSAVEAKVISPIAVIVVALAGISGYAQPSQDLGAALRIWRFLFVLASVLAGLFGVATLMCLMVWRLCTMDNFGVNYTAPLSDGRPRSLARTFLRRHKPEDKFREAELDTPDRRKQR
ncbi:MAG: spore germination protein [Bacillota bacterium]|nr:spore germination protein [Bacillota bacterium]